MTQQPFVRSVQPPGFIPQVFENHIVRHLSDMDGQFSDAGSFERLLATQENPALYEVYEITSSGTSGELMSGVSILHSGRVGEEYYMTKGHFHEILETAEVYHCLSGKGVMVMETPEGQTAVVELSPGAVLYVPPRWAHRSVNTAESGDLITLFTYPADAGHDYRTIETHGFRTLIVHRGGAPKAVENPKWKASTQ